MYREEFANYKIVPFEVEFFMHVEKKTNIICTHKKCVKQTFSSQSVKLKQPFSKRYY